MKHSIAIVDDHILIAKAISGIIENFTAFEVLYECEHGKALQEKFINKKNIPNIILLDISMPIMDGFETALWLKEVHPQVLIIALSMQDDEQSLVKMVKCGANGYLLKCSPIGVENALFTLVKNGFYFPNWATSKVFSSLGSDSSKKKVTINITERETEFLKYTITEMSYKEIAEKMFCSPRTVESYRDNLFEKLGLKTRVGLAVYAIKNGFG